MRLDVEHSRLEPGRFGQTLAILHAVFA